MSKKKATRLVPPPSAPPPFWRRPIGIAIGLVALNLLIYAAVRHFAFVNWDDPEYLTDNANLAHGLTWQSVKWALTTGHTPYWHPLTWLSHLLDVQLFGFDAGAHHVTSLLIHIVNTLLIFEIFRRMTGAAGKSAFVAAVFAAHPLHVESVAWLAERKDVLSTLFWALTVWTYVGYVRRPGAGRYLGALAWFACALMSKPMVVTLPVVLLLLDVWPLGRVTIGHVTIGRAVASARGEGVGWRRALLEKAPFVVLALAAGVATVVVQARVGAMASARALSWWPRVANALVSYVAYLGKAVWPAHLAAFYQPRVSIAPWSVVAAAFALILISVLVIRQRAGRPYLFVGWFWYLVTLAPVIGLLQAGEQSMADRFMYVPLIGLTIVLAWGVPDLVARRPRVAPALPAAAVVVVVLLAVTAHAQVQTWADSVTLWRHAVAVDDRDYEAYDKLGEAERDRGEIDAALAHFQRALDTAPASAVAHDAFVYNDMGLTLARHGRVGEALQDFAAAVRIKPDFAEAQSNFGNALVAHGQPADAVGHYMAAVALKSDFIEAQVGLGGALLQKGRPADAAARYRDALALDATLAEAHNGLGAALAAQGHDAEAAGEYAEAIRLKPDLATAHSNLALLLAHQGKPADAVGEFLRALALDSNQPGWHYNVAILLARQGHVGDAVTHLRAALAIDPGFAAARQALGELAGKSGGR